MANYSTSNNLAGTQQAISSTYKTLLNVYSSSTTSARRGKIYDVLVGTNGTPADNYMEWDISRFSATAILTATAVTPNPLDVADAVALSASYANATTENTYVNNGSGASVFYVGVNQRASYRWVAAPGGELVYPATNLAGLGGRARSGGYTGTATMQFYFTEQ